MPMRCAYFLCQNKSSGRSFFSFPTSNPNRLKKWINNCGNMAITNLSTKALRKRCICSDHFQKRHILHLNGSRKRLSNMAVPVHFRGDDTTETAPHSQVASTSRDELDLVDEPFIEEEDDGEYFIKPEPIKPALHGLQMVPVVYTTRLDDMVVLNSIRLNHHPRDLTAKILEESKPILYSYPEYYSGQINETSFRLLKAKLRKLYDPQMINIKEEPDINPVTLEFYQNFCTTEQSREFNDTSKYSNLLKLCKPLSIVLTKLELQTVSADTYEVEEMEYLQEEGTRSPAPTTNFNVSGSRLLTNGIMEVHDLYSDEYTIYCTDHKGDLIDCLIDSPDNAFKYHSIRDSAEMELQFKYCCWAKRNKHMQSLYPKVLLYTNFRFMMKPHLCPIDKCICCCRKKDNFAKTSTAYTDDGSSVKKSAYLQEDIEIQELEDEIQQKLVQINKAPRLNTNDWIQALLTKATNDPPQVNSQNQSSLIEKALSYKPIPKKQTENRRLLTLKQKKTQYGVIIFRNFALDERDVYEINSNGEVQFHTKLICFNNTNRPDVKKLLQKPKAVYDVCCWFKRESITSKLFEDQYLHPSAVKFMRNRHACLSDKCICCCKPNVGISEATLTDVPFSPQYSYTTLKTITKPINVNNAKANKPKSNSRTITKETNKHPNILRKTLMSQSTNNKHKQRQGSLVAAETSTQRDDDDCEIVEDMQYRPLQPKPLPTEQVKVATVVNVPNISSSELSEEVNTTVASILERFKDVRLTINSNGKVAAALNMPINTLSTVELKVLASILSYAQSQVNLLGLKSEMSLSSFISRSATDNEPEPAKKVEPIKTTQKLLPDGNKNCTTTTNLSSTNVVGNSYISETPNSDDTEIKCETEVNPNELEESATEVQLQLTKLATDFDAIIPPVHKEKVFNSFTNSTSATKQNFNDSFASFIATQYDGPKNSFAPVITSVFSMKDQETAASGGTLSGDSEAMLIKQPADQLSDAKTFGQSTKKFENLSKKRKQGSKTQASKRLRVLSPSQIGSLTSHSISDPAEIYNTFCKPVQNSETMEVCGFTPGVPLLANTSFQLVSVGDPNAQQTKLIPVPNLKPTASDVSGSSKTLVVCPLNMDSNNDHVPVTVSSFSSVAIPTEEFDAPTIKDEPTDDCILGM